MRQPSVLKYAKRQVKKRRAILEGALSSINLTERVLDQVHDAGKLSYKVDLTSMWTDHGEKNVSCTVKGSLKKVIETAMAEFKRVNNRSDVQAQYHVVVITPGEHPVEVALPKEYWEHYTK